MLFLCSAHPATSASPERFFLAPLSAPKRLISAETTRRDPRQSKNRQIIIDTGEIPNARERGDFCTYYHRIISNLSAGKFIYRAARRPYLVPSRFAGSCQGPRSGPRRGLGLDRFRRICSPPRRAGNGTGAAPQPRAKRRGAATRDSGQGACARRLNCGRARAARRG